MQYTYEWPYYQFFYELLHALDWYLADILDIVLSGIVASILTGIFTSH